MVAIKKIVVASANPVKIACTQLAFAKVFPLEEIQVEGIKVPSEVSDQPMGTQETLTGAKNRAENARTEQPDAEYWVGIEGGVRTLPDESMEAFAWIYILSDKGTGKAQTASFALPEKIRSLIADGVELGVADDMVFRRRNSKEGNGAVGILTGNLIDRTAYYTHAVILALIPFLNTELYIHNGQA